MPPNTLDLSRLSPKSLKDLLLSEYKKPDVLEVVLVELTQRNDATLLARIDAASRAYAPDDGGPVI